MASYVRLNAVRSAQITRYGFPVQVRIIRTGWIYDINTNVGVSNDEILSEASATTGIPALLSSFPGTRYANALLRKITVDALPNNHKAFLTLEYDTQGPATGPVTFVLQRRTTVIETETELHPNGLVPMTVTWRNPANPTVDVIRRTAKFRYYKSIQRLLATGYYKDSPPPEAMLSALRSVNDAEWRGLPKGYWLYADQSDVTQDYGKSYNITLELWTKIDEDWSQWDVLRHHNGRYLEVRADDVQGLRDGGYIYGFLSANGVTKAGLYRTKDFSSIFGFGDIA